MATFRQLLGILGALIALGLYLTACGGGQADGTGFTSDIVPQQVAIAADPGGALRWDRPTYEATAGDITFVVKNTSPVAHQFSLEGNGVNYRSKNFKANTTNYFTATDLAPGEYQIVCHYPGHKAAGMVSTLIVR
jgi:plastocyanin